MAAAAAAVALAAEVATVLTTCGITDPASRNILIQTEGLNSLGVVGRLDGDSDVTEMAKRLASRRAADGKVILGTVVIKNLQALVWWVKEQIKIGGPLVAARFDAAALEAALVQRVVDAERSKAAAPKDLATFDPDDFETHENAFVNLLAQTYGALKEPLRYVVRKAQAPAAFNTDAER
jgi:hypothetical protein